MSPVITDTSPITPRLKKAAEISHYLGVFFTDRRRLAGQPALLTKGLWPLLTWCWSRDNRERTDSLLCGLLIQEPGRGWLLEADVVEALARDTATGNPSLLPAARVADFVTALLGEAEAVRGRRARLSLHLEFHLPRLHAHPHLSSAAIAAALRRAGMSEERVHHHLNAVHPERNAYRGIWELNLDDRLCQAGMPGGSTMTETSCNIPVVAPEFGQRSRVSLSLKHESTLAAYFRLHLHGTLDTP